MTGFMTQTFPGGVSGGGILPSDASIGAWVLFILLMIGAAFMVFIAIQQTGETR